MTSISVPAKEDQHDICRFNSLVYNAVCTHRKPGTRLGAAINVTEENKVEN